MRAFRLPSLLCCAALALGALAAPALAAAPTPGAAEATDVQGNSALLLGKLDPNGLPTTYRFQYVDEEGFAQGGFTAASETPEATLAAASEERPVSAAIAGLLPDTLYHLRLLATNSAGTSAGAETTFTTSHGFGFRPGSEGFDVAASQLDGAPATQAGSHPYELNARIGFNEAGEFAGQPGVAFPDGDLKELEPELPPGLVGNPTVVSHCTLAELNTPRTSPWEQSLSGESCPDSSQVGVVAIHTSLGGGQTRNFGIFNLTPPPGFAVEFGFAPFGAPITFGAHIRNENAEYGLTAAIEDFPQSLSVDSIQLTFWGVPWALSHDSERGNCLNEAEPAQAWGKCSVGQPRSFHREALLTLPTSCEGPLAFHLRADSWQSSGAFASASAHSAGEIEGCQRLSLETFSFGQPTSVRASSATGFEVGLEVHQEGLLEPGGLAGSQIRDAVLSLPEGMTINPSVADGLGVCTPAQYAAETVTSAAGAGCPNESKIGAFRVETPLTEEAVNGSLYLAKPFDNPFGALIGIYMVARSPSHGILVKVPGELLPDQSTGRLTAVFEELPQLPYSHLHIFFREGQRAPLASPPTCGTYPVQMSLTPWLDPTMTIHHTSEFTISQGIGGGPCPAGLPPFSPGAVDGSLNANAGSYSPYFLHLTRQDTEQEITLYSAQLPPGLTGKIAGIPYCPDADIEAAKAKSGTEELEHPSCPAASEIGHTSTGYGLGGVLTYAPGRLYLSGPYHGAPLSITAVDSALVGPFDLGVVIVRSAIKVNPQTAQVSIDSTGSDPIPHILDGIPLHLRDIRVYISRSEFTLNPTSCEPFQAASTLMGAGAQLSNPADDVPATVTNLYQATDCSSLKFDPKLSLKLNGGTRRGAFPSLRATVIERAGDANIGKAVVSLPHSEFLAQGHIDSVCSMRQFEAQSCPPGSVYGHARAVTPLLSEPLEGPVYLRSVSTESIPDLVAALRGRGGLEIDLVGKVGQGLGGGMQASYEVLPDAPASKFTLTLKGGKRGLLENSANVCGAPVFATGRLIGQDNSPEPLEVPLKSACKKGRSAVKRGKGR